MFVSKSGEVLESISIRKATMTFYCVCFIAGIFSDSVVVGIFFEFVYSSKRTVRKSLFIVFCVKIDDEKLLEAELMRFEVWIVVI